jgi:hypothetical protein
LARKHDSTNSMLNGRRWQRCSGKERQSLPIVAGGNSPLASAWHDGLDGVPNNVERLRRG